MKCLSPNCDKESVCRGLCLICYKSASRLVCKGWFTWEELEELSRTKPKQIKIKQPKEPKQSGKVGRPGKFTDAEFIEAKKEYIKEVNATALTKELLEGILERFSNRMTEWQKEEIEKMMQPFIKEEKRLAWEEKRASENSLSVV